MFTVNFSDENDIGQSYLSLLNHFEKKSIACPYTGNLSESYYVQDFPQTTVFLFVFFIFSIFGDTLWLSQALYE